MKYVPQTLIVLATLSLVLAIVATLNRGPIAGLNVSTFLHASTNLAVIAVIFCVCYKPIRVIVGVREDAGFQPGGIAMVLAGLTVLTFLLAVVTKLAGSPVVGMKAHVLYVISLNFGLIAFAYCLCVGIRIYAVKHDQDAVVSG